MKKMLFPAALIVGVVSNLLNQIDVGSSEQEQLVLSAIKRSSELTAGMSNSELGQYLSTLSETQMRGFMNNIKGITLENIVVANHDSEGSGIEINQFAATNQPGADLQFTVDGKVVSEAQVKATDSQYYIDQHFKRYPDTPVIGTTEIASRDERVSDAGITNAELEQVVEQSIDDLEDLSITNQVADAGLAGGLLAAGAVAIGALNGDEDSKQAAKDSAQLVGASIGSSLLLDMLIG